MTSGPRRISMAGRLHTATRGICGWRDRLAKPDTQWKRRFSAFETAMSWELASPTESGLPTPIEQLFHGSGFKDLTLLLAVAEHQVELDGQGHASQCDVWALIDTDLGKLSLTVEAKANEKFGETLEAWLSVSSETKRRNRELRWEYLRQNLPPCDRRFLSVPYQILHRCAAAVIEAKRLKLRHAAFLVQSFSAPEKSFQAYAAFCQALGLQQARGGMSMSSVGDISLGVGWADCPFATDQQIAAIA